jgi:hypothetical protein
MRLRQPTPDSWSRSSMPMLSRIGSFIIHPRLTIPSRFLLRRNLTLIDYIHELRLTMMPMTKRTRTMTIEIPANARMQLSDGFLIIDLFQEFTGSPPKMSGRSMEPWQEKAWTKLMQDCSSLSLDAKGFRPSMSMTDCFDTTRPQMRSSEP